jgi:hypothetical protein
MHSGMVTKELELRAAHTQAKPISVLPLIGSTMVVFRWILPFRSAASMFALAMRSLTDHSELKLSSFAATVARTPLLIRRVKRKSGV